MQSTNGMAQLTTKQKVFIVLNSVQTQSSINTNIIVYFMYTIYFARDSVTNSNPSSTNQTNQLYFTHP